MRISKLLRNTKLPCRAYEVSINQDIAQLKCVFDLTLLTEHCLEKYKDS
jgi:hypothetical protein